MTVAVSHPVAIKIDPDIKARIKRLADARQRSSPGASTANEKHARQVSGSGQWQSAGTNRRHAQPRPLLSCTTPACAKLRPLSLSCSSGARIGAASAMRTVGAAHCTALASTSWTLASW